ncbi:MAG TPA: hypothetical protein VEK08_01835 [Planctomycetota bacterium]|nr:hypothetical protein [Planctomycetota bacterium]
METATKKTIGWAVLLTAIGAAFIFALIVGIDRRVPPESLTLPLFAVTGSSLAIWWLRALYRLEPRVPWQLSITDLLAITFLTGLLLSFFQAVIPDYFLRIGLPYGLVVAAGLPFGVMSASHKGLRYWRGRYIYAFGFSTRAVGAIMTGGLVVLFALMLAMEGRPHKVVDVLVTIIGLDYREQGSEWAIWMFRIGFYFLLFGAVFCALAPKINPRQKG